MKANVNPKWKLEGIFDRKPTETYSHLETVISRIPYGHKLSVNTEGINHRNIHIRSYFGYYLQNIYSKL